MKNYLKDHHVTNLSPTAGKYMVMGEGPILSEGVKFVKTELYMMANYWDMTEDNIGNIENDSSEEEDTVKIQ